ncbi:MAG: ribosome maturation factor RimP [Selenomonadales bacterium]|nr:ribosome maturation factor RimP [Selenomonadales bacterium]
MANKVEMIVEELAQQFLEGTEIELVDVEFVKERDWYLRVFIDKENGIDIEDCQNLSEQLEAKLDELDPIRESYYLEVSSPGLDRALKKEKDFVRHTGDKVEAALYAPLNGKKTIVGTLLGLVDDQIKLGVDGEEVVLARQQDAQIKLYLDF